MITMTTKNILGGLIFFILFGLSAYAGATDEPVYDENGNLLQSVDADQSEVELEYDSDGNLVRKRYADGRIVNYEAETGDAEE